MNTRQAEIRTGEDLRAQLELERLLAARRARDAAREERFRRLPTPQQPEPANFCAATDDAPPALTAQHLIAAGLIWLAAMLLSLWLCTAAGMAFLDAIWSLS